MGKSPMAERTLTSLLGDGRGHPKDSLVRTPTMKRRARCWGTPKSNALRILGSAA